LEGGDIFVAQLSSAGTPLWSRAVGDSNSQQVSDLAISSTGDILLAGSFAGTISFDATPQSSTGFEESYLVKLNSTGTTLWARRDGALGGYVIGPTIALQPPTKRIIQIATTGGPPGPGLGLGLGPMTWFGNADVVIGRFLP
jgi:hypothetical protein